MPGILDYLNLARAALKVAEEQHPDSVKSLPPWLTGSLRFADGAEVAYKKGVALWNEGGADPQKLSDEQVLAMVPEDVRKRFPGETKQLVAAVRTGYLTKKTAAAFDQAASTGDPPTP